MQTWPALLCFVRIVEFMLLRIWGAPQDKNENISILCDSGLFNGTIPHLIKTEHFITLRSYRAVLNLSRNPSFYLLHISCSSFRVPLSTTLGFITWHHLYCNSYCSKLLPLIQNHEGHVMSTE